jgi:hypothetical protein
VKSREVSDEYMASIFRIEEEAKQGTRNKQAASRTSMAYPEDGGDAFLRNVGGLLQPRIPQ